MSFLFAQDRLVNETQEEKVEAVVLRGTRRYNGCRDSGGTIELPYWSLEAILTGLIRLTASTIYPAARYQCVGCSLPVGLSRGRYREIRKERDKVSCSVGECRGRPRLTSEKDFNHR